MKQALTRLIYLVTALALASVSESARAVVIDLSEDEIEIRHSFNGADLILFGTIGDSAIADRNNFDVVIVVRGPRSEAVVRKKALAGGLIWVNQDRFIFQDAPGYYAVAANRPLADIAKPAIYASSGIGFEFVELGYDPDRTNAEDAEEFQSALYRIRSRAGLYRQELDSVEAIGEGLFRTNVRLPANVPVGQFHVDAYVFDQGRIIAADRISLTVDKGGFERVIYNFANDMPFLYGLTAVFIALCAGWVAGVVGKK